MNFHEALRQRFIRSADVAAIAQSRVFWLLRPEGDNYPAVTLRIVADDRPQHLKGFDGARPTLVQCDSWALEYAKAHALAQVCIHAIASPAMVDGKRFGAAQFEGPRDLSEQLRAGFTVYRQSVDMTIWHVGD